MDSDCSSWSEKGAIRFCSREVLVTSGRYLLLALGAPIPAKATERPFAIVSSPSVLFYPQCSHTLSKVNTLRFCP